MADWVAWHGAYDAPDSSLARRLVVVQRRLRQALDAHAGGAVCVLSLCAGEGRDVIPVLAERGDAASLAVLVEYDEELARRAATAAGPTVEVRRGDAGDPDLYADVLPVHVLMLCGIFGNIEHASVRVVVDAAPRFLAPGGHVIWTRGGSDPDHRPEIRRWFEAAGLEELAFDGDPEGYGVGLNRLRDDATGGVGPLPRPLFSFSPARS